MTRFISPFRIVFIFLAFAGASILVMPYLNVDLLPAERSSVVTISFSLPNSAPDVVEQSVTAVIEGACSQLKQVRKIKSVSNYNNGSVSLYFDKSADLQYKKFELAAIIRQIYPQLPSGASYPLISAKAASDKQLAELLSYSICAPLRPFQIREETGMIFQKAFAGLSGISETKMTGIDDLQITVLFDHNKCQAWGVSPDQLITSMESYFDEAYPGTVSNGKGEQYFLTLRGEHRSLEAIRDIPLPLKHATPIRLKDVADIQLEEQEAFSYARINGKNAVNFSIYAREGENRVVIAEEARKLMEQIRTKLPEGFDVRLRYDNAGLVREEIDKSYQRALLSIGILVFFVFLVYMSWRYALNLLASLFINSCLVVFMAWLVELPIHLYTVAGLAVSFGIMVDNTIVMLDYYHQWRNRKVFLALLAASFTVVASVCLVFFLPDEERRNLADFALVIVLSLISSLLTALLFIPALYENMKLGAVLDSSARRSGAATKRRLFSFHTKSKQASGRMQRNYFSLISWLSGRRRLVVLLLIAGFGLPVFLLPDHWSGEHWYNRWYNATIGSNRYQEQIKPVADRWLGGALYSFSANVYEKSGYRDPERTKLVVKAALPFGNTPAQLNVVLEDFERYLQKVKGIDTYITNIYSAQEGSIVIDFLEGYGNASLPFDLKTRLINRSLEWGGIEWDIYGVGQAFRNAGDEGIPAFKVIVKGYNYDELDRQALKLAGKLSLHKRVQKVNSNERLEWGERLSSEYVLNLDDTRMALYHTSRSSILNGLQNLSKPTAFASHITLNGHYYPVMLKEREATDFSAYDLFHRSIQLDSVNKIRIDKLGYLELRNTNSSIHKEDRQYIRVVGFEYMGTMNFGTAFLEKTLEDMKTQLPVGYTAEKEGWQDGWSKSASWGSLVLLLLLSVFFICSVLFENFRQAAVTVGMIPVSFIGLFLTFALGEFYFDQGGYAAFILLGGLVTNACIFVINDLNRLRQKRPHADPNKLLIKAALNRSRTILLTTTCTCCGLIPFVLHGQQEVFWFSLAVGMIGGLLFSLFAIFLILPVLCWNRSSRDLKS